MLNVLTGVARRGDEGRGGGNEKSEEEDEAGHGDFAAGELPDGLCWGVGVRRFREREGVSRLSFNVAIFVGWPPFCHGVRHSVDSVRAAHARGSRSSTSSQRVVSSIPTVLMKKVK
jgi:hypothetical protein